METLKDQYAHLNSENEALRAAICNLQQENHKLKNYKKAFFDLRRFFAPEIWDKIEQQALGTETMVGPVVNELVDQQYQLLTQSPSAPSQQPSPAFQVHQSPSHLPSDAQFPHPPTSETAAVPQPPPPPPPAPLPPTPRTAPQ